MDWTWSCEWGWEILNRYSLAHLRTQFGFWGLDMFECWSCSSWEEQGRSRLIAPGLSVWSLSWWMWGSLPCASGWGIDSENWSTLCPYQLTCFHMILYLNAADALYPRCCCDIEISPRLKEISYLLTTLWWIGCDWRERMLINLADPNQ